MSHHTDDAEIPTSQTQAWTAPWRVASVAGRFTVLAIGLVGCAPSATVSPADCASKDAGLTPVEAGTVVSDAGASVASDPRCATQATLLGTHPHASQQPTPLGRTISDTRGWKGVLYFAYGDLEANTGPIYITTFDPKTSTWEEHPVAYVENGTGVTKSTPAFYTHDIERFLPIGDSLWAPAAQPDFASPFNAATAPEYAIATGSNDWTQVDFVPNSLHLVDAIERAPGDIYFTGSAFMSADAGAPPVADGRSGGHVWRSVDGGAFTQLFPDFAADTPGSEYFDLTGAWIFGGALNGIAYLDEAGGIFEHDGGTGDVAWVWGNHLDGVGEFLTPTTFAGHLVFADLGQLYAYDGVSRTNLDVPLFESQGRYQGLEEPLVLFQATEGRFLAVKDGGDVMMTTDLTNWTCIGQAPDDATSIGSLDGVVYFGSVNSGVYGFPAPSW